ncbi:AMP-binding protein [Aldersonia sp. NBC_00410]|uniref:AMP-binding protein n=1 Tax=Aldersonia sp. NBC_00410 TaxID=2975954 RepID=UPI00225BF370|nr:AMP-binding protein [Aldersonia sp. NBC_00410]MCX5046365.1 AMP-binding protein [Aldersonia sp. NBC_00410]
MYPPAIVAERPDASAYVMAESGLSITYRELDEQSNQLAHFWRAHGVAAGDTVVIVMENNIVWPVVMAAGMRSGLYVTPVNWHLKPAELAVLFEEAAPRAIVTSRAVADTVAEALARSGVTGGVTICADGHQERSLRSDQSSERSLRSDQSSERSLRSDQSSERSLRSDQSSERSLRSDQSSERSLRSDQSSRPGFATFDDVLAGQPTTPIADELLGARVLYSGGTTGRPKRFAQQLLGVHPADAPQRHSGLVEKLGVDASTRLLSPAPNYHAAPFTFTLITLAAGGTVVCMERFDAAAAMKAIVRHQITHSQWVPTMLVRLLRLPERERIALSPSHRVAFTSGAPCPVDVKEQILDWWGAILHEYYGASEGYGHTYIGPDEVRDHPGSVGRPFGAARVRIVDADGAPVDDGVRGRVCFESTTPQTYDSAGEKAALRQMGDIGYLDDGYLYLVGREGFMIISGGVNIYPEEIEEVLLSHPDVIDAGVVGIPDPEFGESVKAVVETRPGSVLTDTGLIAFCRERLAHFKAPRVVEFTDDMPRLPTGKLDKRSLTARFAQGEKV